MGITETPGTSGSRLNRYSTRCFALSDSSTLRNSFCTCFQSVTSGNSLKWVNLKDFEALVSRSRYPLSHWPKKTPHYHLQTSGFCVQCECVCGFTHGIIDPAVVAGIEHLWLSLAVMWAKHLGECTHFLSFSGEMLWRVFPFTSDKQCLNIVQSLDNWIAKFSECI